MSDEMEAKEANSKIRSRKFIVWIAATFFEAASLVLCFVTKDTTLAQQFTPWWGGISMAYIGGNVAQKFVKQEEKK